MQPGIGRGGLAVLARTKHHQIAARLDRHRRENPLARRVRIIAQRPSGQTDQVRAQVSEFHPVAVIIVLVAQAGDVDCDKLIEPDVLRDDHIGIQHVAPACAAEHVGRRGEILNARVHGKLNRDRPARRRRKAKQIRGAAEGGDIGRRVAIDQQVSRVDPGHVLRESDLDLRQGRNGRAGKRKLVGHGGRHVVDRPHQAGVHVKVAAGRVGVEGLYGDDVRARLQHAARNDVPVDDWFARDHRRGGDGGFSPRHIGASYFRAVDPRHIAIVDVDGERQLGKVRWTGYHKSPAHENGQPHWSRRGAARHDRRGNRGAVANGRDHGRAPAGVNV